MTRRNLCPQKHVSALINQCLPSSLITADIFLFKCFILFYFGVDDDDYHVINDVVGPSSPSGVKVLLSSIPKHKKVVIYFRGHVCVRCLASFFGKWGVWTGFLCVALDVQELAL